MLITWGHHDMHPLHNGRVKIFFKKSAEGQKILILEEGFCFGANYFAGEISDFREQGQYALEGSICTNRVIRCIK